MTELISIQTSRSKSQKEIDNFPRQFIYYKVQKIDNLTTATMLLTVRKNCIMNQLFEKMVSKADDFFNNWAEQLYLLPGTHHGKNVSLDPHNPKNMIAEMRFSEGFDTPTMFIKLNMNNAVFFRTHMNDSFLL